jgi:hypothetical protein
MPSEGPARKERPVLLGNIVSMTAARVWSYGETALYVGVIPTLVVAMWWASDVSVADTVRCLTKLPFAT